MHQRGYIVFLALTLCVVGAFAREHHRKTDHHGNSTGVLDPNELLPSLCANGATVTRGEREANIASLETCKYHRDDVIDAVKELFVLNEDDEDCEGSAEDCGLRFTIEDCYAGRHRLLPAIIEPFVESCETIFDHCDCDADRVITTRDFHTAIDTCLRNCRTLHDLVDHVKGKLSDKMRQRLDIN